MSKNKDGENRNLPPTLAHLAKLRREGTIPISTEFRSAIGFSAALLAIFFGYFFIANDLLAVMVLDTEQWAKPELSNVTVTFYSRSQSALFVILMIAGIASLSHVLAAFIDSGGVVISTKKMKLDFNHLNPVDGITKIFGLTSIVDLLRSIIKTILLIAAFYVVYRFRLNDILWAATCGLDCVEAVGRDLLFWIFMIVAAILMLSGLTDLIISRMIFRSENKMSVREVKRENRDHHGDPLILRQRKEDRQRAMDFQSAVGPEHTLFVVHSNGQGVGVAYNTALSAVPYVSEKAVTPQENSALLQNAKLRGRTAYFDETLASLLIVTSQVGDQIPPQTFDKIAFYLVNTNLD